MKRGGLKIVCASLFAVILFFASCKKEDDNAKYNPKGTYIPTKIDPFSIFPAELGMPSLPSDNPFTIEGVYLGRMLFYDPILSYDSSISCASCHKQEFAFSDPIEFSPGAFGLKTKRNAPPLYNLAYSKHFFWDGRVTNLRDLVFEPIQAHNEMAMTLPKLEGKLKNVTRYIDYFNKAFGHAPNLVDMSKAIEQFMLTIVSDGSRFNKFFPGDSVQLFNFNELKGAQIFNGLVHFDPVTKFTPGADCFHCHGGELAQQQNFNMGGLANNGLDDVLTDLGYGGIINDSKKYGTFKAPSLLNIALTAPYMHDGRLKTLDEVIEHYSDKMNFNSPNIHSLISSHGGIQLNLTAEQKTNLKAYLMTMTDNKLITNPAYGNPFKK
jgi:cytochrome c peroxidase